MKESGDWPSEVLNYNNEVGITAVAESETRVCACHGASGEFFIFRLYSNNNVHGFNDVGTLFYTTDVWTCAVIR